MPTYDYQCEACGHRFEKFQSITSAPIRKCPECGKSKVKRLIGTGAGLIFKGNGFYITDYRDAGYKEKAKTESGGSGDSKPSESTPGAADSGAKAEPAKSKESQPKSSKASKSPKK